MNEGADLHVLLSRCRDTQKKSQTIFMDYYGLLLCTHTPRCSFPASPRLQVVHIDIISMHLTSPLRNLFRSFNAYILGF
jgi:hypothetical protein